MKEVKTKESGNTPKVLTDTAKAPKELAKRSMLQAKERARNASQRPETQQDDSPDRYAENRVEQTSELIAYKTVEGGKNTVKKANDIRKKVNEIRKEKNTSQTNSYKAGRERAVRSSQRRTVKQAATNTRNAAKTTKATAKGTVKTAKHTVKAAAKTVKTAEKTVKTAAKATEKAAQAAAKAAQAAARAAAAAAKAIAKAVVAVVKWIIAAVKALIAAIAAGGWVAVGIIVVVVLVVALLAIFGVFSANEAPDGSKPLTEAIETIDDAYHLEIKEKIASLTAQKNADVVEIIFEGDMESLDSPIPNWADVVGIYSAKMSLDTENPQDVTVISDENIDQLETVFRDMNSISYRTETETETSTVYDEYGAIVYDEDGEPKTETTTTLYIYIDATSLDYRDGAELYRFSDDQNEMLTELMRPEYYPLFAELLGDTVGDGGEYGFGININPDLPASELGAQIVEAAKKYLSLIHISEPTRPY